MDILKKNLTNIICSVIAILAIVGSFWPLGGYEESLQNEATQRVGVAEKIKLIVGKPRKIPAIHPDGNERALTIFPNRVLVSAVTAAIKNLGTQKDRMLAKAELLNVADHTLLEPGALPNPTGSAAFDFRSNLAKELTRLREAVLKGGTPPTIDQIEKEKSAVADRHRNDLIMIDGKPINEAKVTAATVAEQQMVPQKLADLAARSKKIYLDPDVLTIDSHLKSIPGAPSPSDIWYAQVEAWVQQDICAAISQANHDSKDITDAVVKQLVKLEIPPDVSMYCLNPAPTASPAGLPPGHAAPAMFSSGGAGNLTATETPTRRYCNELYDVVHFRLVVYVDADKIESFLKTLQAGRFITVRNIDFMQQVVPGSGAALTLPVGGAAAAGMPSGLYVYGPAPVAMLDLSCEQIFMRSWTWGDAKHKQLMPDDVQKILNPRNDVASH